MNRDHQRFGKKPASEPRISPKIHERIVVVVSRPTVHITLRPIILFTVSGKAKNDGPRSTLTTRFQNPTYWSRIEPFSPYRSCSESRSAFVASGSRVTNELRRAIA